MKAVRRLLIEKVIAPCAIEMSGDRPATIKPTIDQASFKVSDPKGKYNVRLTKTNLARILGHGVSISLGPHIVVESNELNEVTSLLKNTHNGV